MQNKLLQNAAISTVIKDTMKKLLYMVYWANHQYRYLANTDTRFVKPQSPVYPSSPHPLPFTPWLGYVASLAIRFVAKYKIIFWRRNIFEKLGLSCAKLRRDLKDVVRYPLVFIFNLDKVLQKKLCPIYVELLKSLNIYY